MDFLPPGIDPTKTPVAPNPNGDAPNFVDPPSLASAVLAVGVTLIGVTVVLVTLRLVANLKVTGKLGLDDYLCLFAEVGGISYWALVHSLAQDGGARHTWDVPVSTINKSFIQRSFSHQMIAGPIIWASKAAILALYVRIFGRVRWLRLTSYGLILSTFLVFWSDGIVATVYCLPRNGAPWDSTTLARCGSPVAWFVMNGVSRVVVDVILFVLPFPIIHGLQLGKQQRAGLVIVFSVGLLTIATSLASLIYRILIFYRTDPIWHGMQTIITMLCEIFGAIIVSCAPAISSFWSNILTKTKLYSRLRSGSICRASRTTNARTPGRVIYTGDDVHDCDTSQNPRPSRFQWLEDGVSKGSRRTRTESYRSTETSISMEEMIAKASPVDQASERI